MQKVFKVLGVLLLIGAIGIGGTLAWFLYPHENPQVLPNDLISISSDEGEARLLRAEHKADYESLAGAFQSQSLASFCGVASGVTVLSAFGVQTNQSDFFTDQASQVRSQLSVVFGGMSLPDLNGLLQAHDLNTSVKHADQFDVDAFREQLIRNLADPSNYLLINYQREQLGQAKSGHISPVAAYDVESDSLLIIDTAAHKYPPTWHP